jgi:hypothetical protein
VIKLGRALAAAQRKFAKHLRPGAILPVFLPLDAKHVKKIQEAFARDGKVRVVDAGDAEAPRVIRSRRKGQVIIAYVGPVTRDLFDHFYDRATLGGVAAGKNTMDLLRHLGQVHLNMKYRFELPQLPPTGRRLLAAATKELNRADLQQGHEALAAFFTLSKKPVLREHFGALGAAADHAEDKVFQGLVRLVDLLEGQPEAKPTSRRARGQRQREQPSRSAPSSRPGSARPRGGSFDIFTPMITAWTMPWTIASAMMGGGKPRRDRR